MTRLNAFAAVAAALTLGVFACDRNDNRASETNTTSAQPGPLPVEPATPSPLPATTQSGLDEAKDGGHGGHVGTSTGSTLGANTGSGDSDFAKDGGHVTTTSGSTFGAKAKDAGAARSTAAPAGADRDRQVAPGHITTPADRGPGTGAPNSNGSHNIGSGVGVGGSR
jgi:hypothetical protein